MLESCMLRKTWKVKWEAGSVGFALMGWPWQKDPVYGAYQSLGGRSRSLSSRQPGLQREFQNGEDYTEKPF